MVCIKTSFKFELQLIVKIFSASVTVHTNSVEALSAIVSSSNDATTSCLLRFKGIGKRPADSRRVTVPQIPSLLDIGCGLKVKPSLVRWDFNWLRESLNGHGSGLSSHHVTWRWLTDFIPRGWIVSITNRKRAFTNTVFLWVHLF